MRRSGVRIPLAPPQVVLSNWTTRFLTIVIPLIVFLSLQGYLVRGLLSGSVKG